MSAQNQRPSAEIYIFPKRTKPVRGFEPGETPIVSLALQRMPGSVGESWYHEAAVAEERDKRH